MDCYVEYAKSSVIGSCSVVDNVGGHALAVDHFAGMTTVGIFTFFSSIVLLSTWIKTVE
jgi:hypothetical protein